ncbi:MAG: VOC family protein [Candidatus Bathyarchaeota archaeon]|nr:VOC family protein [Candidatus Bathyarchaeota archaeon]MDW8040244.1 VOC family protein [Nitrososphaerota archaeon]
MKTVWCITFYVGIFGLEKKYEHGSYFGFECSGVEIGLIPKLKGGERIAPISPSINFLGYDAEEFYNGLESKGVKFVEEMCEEPWGVKHATFTDLDGNLLEIVQINWENTLAGLPKELKRNVNRHELPIKG